MATLEELEDYEEVASYLKNQKDRAFYQLLMEIREELRQIRENTKVRIMPG